jgi:hypothetical protein
LKSYQKTHFHCTLLYRWTDPNFSVSLSLNTVFSFYESFTKRSPSVILTYVKTRSKYYGMRSFRVVRAFECQSKYIATFADLTQHPPSLWNLSRRQTKQCRIKHVEKIKFTTILLYTIISSTKTTLVSIAKAAALLSIIC